MSSFTAAATSGPDLCPCGLAQEHLEKFGLVGDGGHCTAWRRGSNLQERCGNLFADHPTKAAMAARESTGSWEHWRKKWNGEGDFSLAILVAVFSFKEHGRNKIADWIQYVAFFIKLLLDNGVLWYEDCVGYYRCWSPLVIFVIFAAGLRVHLIRNS